MTTPPKTFVNTNREYKGFKLEDVVPRPGSLDILKKPSRYNKGVNRDEGKVLHNLPDTQK